LSPEKGGLSGESPKAHEEEGTGPTCREVSTWNKNKLFSEERKLRDLAEKTKGEGTILS